MKMKIKGGVLVLAAAGLFGAQAVAAAPLDLTNGDQIKLSRTGTSSSYGGAFGGGEFTVNGVAGSVLNGPGDSFMTFCVEFPEHISLNTNYFAQINTGAVNGGAGSAGTYDGDPDGTSSFDPLSTATAWLYTQFRSGTLSGFANNGASNNSLQLAFWKLENEFVGQSATNTSTALYAYNHDSTAQGWVSDAIDAGWTDLGNVRVLNLYDTYNAQTGYFSGNHQDQLYLLPVPEPEIYAMLAAGLGLMGFVARRRKQVEFA